MRHHPMNQYDVARAVAKNAVSDLTIAALGVRGWSFNGFPARRIMSGYPANRAVM